MKFFLNTLLLLVAPCLAFYPYHFNAAERSASNAPRLRRSPHSPNLRFPLRAVKRSNSFSISKANPPAQANSAGVDQDGSDLSYMVEVQFGLGKKTLSLLLDSAAVNTWIMSSSCTTDACTTHNTYGSSDSSTLQVNSNTFSISYGTGQVSGVDATDSVTFLSKTFPLTFGLASTVSSDFADYPMDGILGIGRLDDLTSNPNGVKAPTIVDTLVSQNIITAKLFGLRLSRASDGGNDGEINFGSPDTSAFSGSLNYVAALKNTDGFWEIPITSISFNGKTASIQSGVTVLLDSGTSYMLVPPTDADAIHAVIPGSKKNGEVYTVPCNTNTPLTLTFGGQAYTILPVDYIGAPGTDGTCASNVVARTTFSATQWLVGDVFLKNVYTVFDYDGSRIGFGQPKSKLASSSYSTPSNQVPFPTDGLPSSSSLSQAPNSSPSIHQTQLQSQTNANSGKSPQPTPVPNGSQTPSPSSAQASITTTSRPATISGGSGSNTITGASSKQTSPSKSSASISFASNYSIWFSTFATIYLAFIVI